jgi:dipeptidyl aminopeptidase/acylaminoacyl peptidase
MVAALAVTACGTLANPSSSDTALADGTILEHAPCRVPDDWGAALNAYYVPDIQKAGLAKQLAAQPLTTIFPPTERERYAAASEAGRCERVVYASSGLRVVGYVVHPPVRGPHPVIVWLRGGNRAFGAVEPVTLLNLVGLAERGFVVVATQYRGVDGGEGTEQYGGADVDDVLALVPLARSLPDADTEHLYLLGGSRGAMEGTLALRRGLPARAAVWRGGLFDLELDLAARPDLAKPWSELMPDWESSRTTALKDRSAIHHAAEIRVPQLIVHGRQDWRASLAGAQGYAAALDEAGIEHRLVVYEDDEHQLVLHRAEWLGAAVEWFKSH